MPEVVAEKTGLTTISGLRSRDIVTGGQGFPLTALADYRLFHDPHEDRLLIHLGGHVTLVWLPLKAVREVPGLSSRTVRFAARRTHPSGDWWQGSMRRGG